MRQIDRLPMGAAISFYMSGNHMRRMEKDWVVLVNLNLYVKIKRYVDDTIIKKVKTPQMINYLGTWTPFIKKKKKKKIVETNSTRFLDTGFKVNPDCSATTTVFWKLGIFPAFWHSQIPNRCKRNNINGDLLRACRTVSNFD